VLESLPDGEYEVCIDADLAPGRMTYGEVVIPGTGPGEVLLSTPACHPALGNDNLSGMVLLSALAAELAARPRLRHSYRFLWSPGTIGPLAWLSRNEDRLDRIVAGLAVMCVGDPGPFTYKRSRRGDAAIDRAAACALRDRGAGHEVIDFVPWGGDERQFCSPGFDLPVGVLTRTPPGAFPENHTSADDLDYITAAALGESAAAYLAVIDVLEGDAVLRSTCPKGEPQLGRRGLTRRMGGQKGGVGELAMFWLLNLADGRHSLLEAAERSGLPFHELRAAADALEAVGLVVEEGR
jgi:aminopeptidase-like protein